MFTIPSPDPSCLYPGPVLVLGLVLWLLYLGFVVLVPIRRKRLVNGATDLDNIDLYSSEEHSALGGIGSV